jgi:hypothetical protein
MEYNRIQQLAEQAGFEKDMSGLGIWDSADFQHFVALLIKECACEISEYYHPMHSFQCNVANELSQFLQSITETAT